LDGAWAHGTQSLGNGSVAGCVRPCARSLGKTCVCRRRTKASTCNSPSPRSKGFRIGPPTVVHVRRHRFRSIQTDDSCRRVAAAITTQHDRSTLPQLVIPTR
jgi:hypothetical protein